MKYALLLAIVALAAPTPRLDAQIPPDSVRTDSARTDSLRSTLLGVYTEEQAAKGKDLYLGHCQSCHTAADFTSNDFKANWVGKLVAEFFTYLVENMPESEPGALSQEQYTQVTAYVLQLNALPVGPAPLPIGADSLKAIKFEVAPAPGGAVAMRPGRGFFHPHPRR